VRRHVFCHHRICANSGVVANSDWPQDLCASSDVDMAAYDRDPWSTPDTQSDLLKNETVHANSGVGVNNDSVGMRDQESPANLTIERNVCAGDDAPKTMPQDQTLTNDARNDSSPLMPILITPDAKKQFSTRIPKLSRPFPGPVGDLRANQRSVVGVIVEDVHSRQLLTS
jgi:hypothetical protein